MTAEDVRLDESRRRVVHWKRWGPYLAERAWGTVREDYSADSDAWSYFPHDHARSRAYRWNEDGLAGICDRHQHICLALALWNGRDAILKERLFGVSGPRGQPRRGREGGVLLSRQHADAFLHALALQVSAARISVRAARRRERAGAHGRTRNTSSPTPACSRRTATSTWRSSSPSSTPRTSVSSSRRPTAAPTGARSTCCPTVWFRNTWSWDPDAVRPRLWQTLTSRAASSSSTIRVTDIAGCTSRRRGARGPTCCSPRTRRTSNACTRQPRAGRYFKDGINDRVVDADAPTGVNAASGGHEGVGVVRRPTLAPARACRTAAAERQAACRASGTARRRAAAPSPCAGGRPTSSMRR